jgi:hypothetical protein
VKNEKLNYWRVAVNIILDNGEAPLHRENGISTT